MAQHSLVCFVCVFLKVNGYFLNRNKGINKKQEARNWKRGEEKISTHTNEQMLWLFALFLQGQSGQNKDINTGQTRMTGLYPIT